MREILFRGKSKNNGKWYQGDLVTVAHKRFIDDDVVKERVIPETVGQFVGLTDKNGKKIFEGDYWLDTDGDYLVYVVEFREGQFGFVCYGWKGVLMPYGFDETAGDFGEIDFSPMTDFIIDLIEIDGNIHDNPELLRTPQNDEVRE